jgi:ribosomal protein L9
MFNKGDKVSVLEAINGVVISTKDKEVTIETEDGFMMTFLVNEILKVNETSNLMDSIKRINRDERKRKKRSRNREVLSKSAKIRTRAAPEFDLHIENW